MRIRCITDLVDVLDGRVQGRIVADGLVCPEKVIVDGTGTAHERNLLLLVKDRSSGQRAISSNRNHTVDALGTEVFSSNLTTFRGAELI